MSEGFQIAMKNGQGTKAKKKIEKLLRELLLDIGENPYREGLVDTPARMAEIYTMNSELDVTFTEAGETIIAKDIEFYSMCEHHMLPFFGNIDIAYLPGGKVVGISKLVRVVEKYARRMQIQERLIKEIADKITRRGVRCSCRGRSKTYVHEDERC